MLRHFSHLGHAKRIILDLPGFDPGASRMQTVHSTD